jgi:isopentenyldiphosphate isomerase
VTELIDIYDANLMHKGVMDRGRAHREGHWHRTFHCWIVNGQGSGSVLLQLRSNSTYNFPNVLDVSAAGHLTAGETLHDGIREVEEELGITVDRKSLHELGYRIEATDEANGDENREYQAVYLLRSDVSLLDYRPNREEISALFWLPIEAGLPLFSNLISNAAVDGIRFDDSDNDWVQHARTICTGDFLPRIQNYYTTVFIMAERLVKGHFPVAIS